MVAAVITLAVENVPDFARKQPFDPHKGDDIEGEEVSKGTNSWRNRSHHGYLAFSVAGLVHPRDAPRIRFRYASNFRMDRKRVHSGPVLLSVVVGSLQTARSGTGDLSTE